MGTFRGGDWRRGLTWLLLVATTAALEVHDEPLIDLDNGIYQDDFNIDVGPPAQLDTLEPQHGDDLLHQLIRSLQLHGDARAPIDARPIWSAQYQNPIINYIGDDTPEMMERERLMKRVTGVLNGSGTNAGFKSLDRFKPQRKWKIKKGKVVGRQRSVCYFKLCAFRPPVM